MGPAWVSLLAVFACSADPTPPLSPPGDDDDAPTTPDAVEASVVEGTVLGARCAPTVNAMRIACEASTEVPTTLDWSVPGRLAPLRTEGTEHEVVLFGAEADASVAWQAVGPDGSASGRVDTPALPAGVRSVLPVVSGDPTAVAPVLFRYGCGSDDGAMVVDGAGRVRWYETLEAPATSVAFDGDDGWLAILNRGSVYRAGLDGRLRFRTDSLPDPLHHDASVDDADRTWALTAFVEGGVVADGLAVWDPAGDLLATWRLTDHVPTGPGQLDSLYWRDPFVGIPDWSHGNSITVGEGLGLLSLRWLDAVVALEADPEAPEFGALRWVLSGTADAQLGSDLLLPPGEDFVGQHHPTFTHDGRLMLFDNRVAPERSRVLQLALDHDAGTASIVESWTMDSHCDVQGAAYEQSDGTVVATCAPTASARAFRRGEAEAVWRLDVSCALPPHRLVPRFQPVEGVFADGGSI